MDEAITSKIVTAQSIETKLLEQQTRQVRARRFPPPRPAFPAPTSLLLTADDLRPARHERLLTASYELLLTATYCYLLLLSATYCY